MPRAINNKNKWIARTFFASGVACVGMWAFTGQESFGQLALVCELIGASLSI